jgi:hypothetical protein
MNRFWGLIALILFLPVLIFASDALTINSNEIFDFSAGNSKLSKIKNYPILLNSKDLLAFDLKKSMFDNLIKNKPENLTINQFPVSASINAEIELKVDKINIDKYTKLFVYSNNQKKQIEAPKSLMYSGKIKGEENSYISLVYTNGILFGYIKHNDGTLVSIGPSNNNDPSLHLLTPHISSDIADPDEKETYSCLTEDYHGNQNEISDILKYKNDKLQSKSKLLNANIICEGAFDFYKIMGSDLNRCTAYIFGVMAMTSKIYSEFINVQLTVSEVHIRQDAVSDPYQKTSDLSDKLGTMPSVWKSYTTPRAVLVLFADLKNQPANTVIAGISFGGSPNRGSLCSKNRGYCVLGINGYYKYPTIHYTWDVNVAAHEIGHNFSAPHTHNCYYEPNMIDTCVTQTLPFQVSDACVSEGKPIPIPGTIMSYCHVTNATRSVELIFHPRSIPVMRTAADSCNCMKDTLNTPLIALLSPLGGSKYRYGNHIDIRWASANISNVNIFLSLDNGKTWEMQLGKYINSGDSIVSIPVPHIKTDSALVKIVDADNNEIYDVSMMPFSIFYQELTFLTPKKGDSCNTNENLSTIWNQHFSDTVRLEFSSDGGKNWSVFDKTDRNTYETQPLGITSNNCKFRITSLFDNTTTESAIFSIGESTAKLLSPNGSEVWNAKSDYTIKWESNNLNKCFLEYSIDDGKSWRKITYSKINASDGQYIWNVAENITDSALVRILPALFNVEPLDISDRIFSIIEASTDVSDVKSVTNSISITSISPNPFSQNTTVSINNPTTVNEESEIIIIDESGKTAFSYGILEVPANSVINQIIKTETLAQGNYFMILKSKSNIISYPIKIIK